LQRLYVLFFIELGSRRVHFAGCTSNPSAPWVTQQGRQLTWTIAGRPTPVRFLIRDRDQKFTDRFDGVFLSDGIQIIRTPFRAPQANGVAERFVRTVRSECLDWLLVLNAAHLEGVVRVFMEHYNGHRPHRAWALTSARAKTSGSAAMERRSGRAPRPTWWCDSRVPPGGVTRFLHPTGSAQVLVSRRRFAARIELLHTTGRRCLKVPSSPAGRRTELVMDDADFAS
jgi:hypothetical protein